MLRFCIGLLIIFGCPISRAHGASHGIEVPELAAALSARYAPFAEWRELVDVEALSARSVPRYWRPAAAIREARSAEALPLAGLRLALDPGHIGGRWAQAEGRRFRIADDDHWVMEGELVLEVAHRTKAQLEALGAEVSLLRENNLPVNPRAPVDYLEAAAARVERPPDTSIDSLIAYGAALRGQAIRLSVIVGELAERARQINVVLQPDAVVSLHINASPWPEAEREAAAGSRAVASGREPVPSVAKLRLVPSNHLHVLIFGCMSTGELQSEAQRAQLATKLLNGSGPEEQLLGSALADALARHTGLPPSVYGEDNAILLDEGNPYLFARNLMLLRQVACPVVLLEPYVANSEPAYARIQRALSDRAAGVPPTEDDILLEYADAVVEGIRRAYGGRGTAGRGATAPTAGGAGEFPADPEA